MRTKIMIAFAIIVLALLNYGIYEKEQIIEYGETILFELRPFDPRSIMQGDYMLLGYRIEENASSRKLVSQNGYIVIHPDENNVAQFVRFHENEDLAPDEKLIRFRKQHDSVVIVPNSFFFQEGHAKYYNDAKYGVFKFDKSGKSLLVNLANENKEIIVVPSD